MSTVLLGVAHGSRDEASQEVVRRLLAGAVALRPGLRTADAYVDNASPSIANALQALAADGVDDVVVLPLLLTSATHSKTDVAAVVRAGHPGMRLRPGVEVVVCEPLGVSDELAQLVLQRYDEALGADLRMNCDVCMYRIALPGREGRVGELQVPHSHPDD
ncbi:MAG: CbiX/SirB N-terminal domain-containing protein [Actinobacteria bacterium]|nr:CbiX/SirB N-terminal domain-containing protein [Actinomycetota bacterium]